jgi:hypothetical protein
LLGGNSGLATLRDLHDLPSLSQMQFNNMYLLTIAPAALEANSQTATINSINGVKRALDPEADTGTSDDDQVSGANSHSSRLLVTMSYTGSTGQSEETMNGGSR